MLIYFQITILEKQLKSLTERIRLFNTLKFQRGWNGVTKSGYSQKLKVQNNKQYRKTPLVFMIYLPLIKKWTWGESNSRPNEETICFLHAYLCLRFSSISKTKSHQPMPYPLIFRKSYGEELKLSPILLCRFIKRFGARAFERHLVSTTLAEIKLIYYTSIKQREHNFRCQIKF